MAVATEIAEMEDKLSEVGQTVKALCEEAGVNQSTWTRWKAGSHTPNMATWQKVRAAHDRLVALRPHARGQ